MAKKAYIGVSTFIPTGSPFSTEQWETDGHLIIAGSIIAKSGEEGWNEGCAGTKESLAMIQGVKISAKMCAATVDNLLGFTNEKITSNPSAETFVFGLYCANNGKVSAYESGVEVFSGSQTNTSYTVDDILSVEVDENRIRYCKNGTAFYTSAQGLSGFMYGAVGVYQTGNALNEVLLYDGDAGEWQGTARKIKKGYVGAGNLARKIKKGYIGIGGVARPFWSGGELAYYGTITELSVARRNLAATSVGNYALFGGGDTNNATNTTKAVDAYDMSLTRTTPTVLSAPRCNLAATIVGNYGLFGGGNGSSSGSSISSVVDAYNTSLTQTTPTALNISRYWLSATTVGDYALFGGGRTSNSISSAVDAYDASLTRTTPNALSKARYDLAAATVGNYALFGGGNTGSATNVVDAYDMSLTRTTPTVLSAPRYNFAATTIGDYALFGGGWNSSVVDAYDTSLTRTIPTVLSTSRHYLTATTVGDYALFGGGYNSSVVDAYNTSLTRTIPTALSTARCNLAATTVGDYALFGGGADVKINTSSVVDAYVVS